MGRNQKVIKVIKESFNPTSTEESLFNNTLTTINNKFVSKYENIDNQDLND